MSCASSLSIKTKIKEIQKKRNIKSRKIDKRKMLVFKVFHNNLDKKMPQNYIRIKDNGRG